MRWQKAVQDDLRSDIDVEELARRLDGRLTSLETLAELSDSTREIVRVRASEYGLLTESVRHAIATYPRRPAAWLVGEDSATSQSSVSFVAQALFETLKDGHREALIKCLPIWSEVQAGCFKSDQQMRDILKIYPNDDATRSVADTIIRASWGARRGASLATNPTQFDSATDWAKIFWGTNSMTSRCIRQRELDKDGEPAVDETSEDGSPASGGAQEGSAHLQQLMMDLMSSYCEALESAPSPLYCQERQEVHAGLVSRVSREVITALGDQDLWCMEHGAHITRILVEVRIYLQWMATQEPLIYREFQEYGAGKAKLYARSTREVAEVGASIGIDEAIQEFERLSHNEGHIDHRVVDTRDSFAGGKSVREMAKENGLLDLYRRAYSIASGISHSEWWSVETHCMERCYNILHRGHLIPSLSLNSGGNDELARSWVDSAYSIMRISLSILGTESAAVRSAFEWMGAPSQENVGE
ncbi:DUF5677 domain-containing protein [Pseudonocardia nantongensis]|uniref:DUF5677 domain-containing protein n=1 Tax=Pseudonocardia nantongensis TaxID=1181885 RepID=UPI0039786AAA